jgi:hypothetical protein
MGVISLHSSWSQSRPKSASHQQREIEIVKFWNKNKRYLNNLLKLNSLMKN